MSDKIYWIILSIIILIALSYFFAQPYFEAKTFNVCTGGNAGYFDALFADLRVFECKK